MHHTRNNIKNKKESKEKLWGICKGINKVFFSINKEILVVLLINKEKL
jgi:hypothetical protein